MRDFADFDNWLRAELERRVEMENPWAKTFREFDRRRAILTQFSRAMAVAAYAASVITPGVRL